MSKPLVSILMTCYNRENYIAEAMESVLATTYENYEFIIVDDCSSDNTPNIVRTYQEKYPQIRFYQNEQNLGDYPNRNKVASYAKGKYLKYVDSDDMIFPYCIDAMVYFMEQCPEVGFGLMGSRLSTEGEKKFPIVLTPNEAFKRHYFQDGIFYRSPLSSIIRRDAFEEIGGFTPDRKFSDYALWHRLGAKFPMLIMPFGMVWYRKHSDQESVANTQPEVIFKYFLYSYKFVKNEATTLDKDLREQILTLVKKKMNRFILRTYFNHSFKMGRMLKRSMNDLMKQ